MRGDLTGAGSGHDRRSGGELFRPEESKRVPWLEADEEDESEAGFAPGRALAVILGGLALIAALAGGAWWLLARGEAGMVADGSIIQAPDAPYKVRPAQPGGTQVDGTGDYSFAVAEGEASEGLIAGEEADAAEEGAAGGTGVQIGAFPSREEASLAWGALSVRIPALAGRSHRILEGSADSGAIFRLQAVATSSSDAAALCEAIRADGGDCQVKQ